MVRNYVRKTDRQSWSTKKMAEAILAVSNGTSINVASTKFNIPRATLQRRVHLKSSIKTLGCKTIFTNEQEKDIVRYIFNLQVRHFGITILELRRLAFDLANLNKIKNSFNKEKQLAGIDWVSGFRVRHPQIVLRTAEHISLARVSGFNKNEVRKFFNLLEDCQINHRYLPSQIYNVDETGVSTVSI
jgi:hypothetical protein